jgi:hypothetical protein
MEDRSKQMLLFLAEQGSTPEKGVTLDPDDQTLMSRATYFRAVTVVEEEGLLIRLGGGHVRLVYREPVAIQFQDDIRLGERILEAQRTIDGLTKQYFENLYAHRKWAARVCSMCGGLEECIKNRKTTCIKYGEFDTVESRKALDKIAKLFTEQDLSEHVLPVSAETVSAETRVYIDQELGSESTPVSAETSERTAIPSLQKDPDQESKAPPTPPTDRSHDVRDQMRHILATSKRPEDEKKKVKDQKREIWDMWTAGMVARYGKDFEVGKLVGKDSTLVVKLISGYGLELTKKIVVVYLDHWDELKALNTWMKDTVPTVGMLWHFRQSVVAVATGKASWDVSKRTADEYVEDDGSGNNGRWPDREGPKATPPA